MGCKSSKPLDRKASIRNFYKIGKVLGSGAFGQVRECTHKVTKEEFAVKIIEKRNDTGFWSNNSMFVREVKLLKAMEHECIIKLYEFYEDSRNFYAILEKCRGGEVFAAIVKRRRLTEKRAIFLCYQMLVALSYVHSMKIVHRDVKAENFLFVSNQLDSPIKLIDFGMSAQLKSEEEKLRDVCGSPHYLSPELIKRDYGMKADIWALGVLTYLMLYGHYPYDGPTTAEIVKKILNEKIDYEMKAIYRTTGSQAGRQDATTDSQSQKRSLTSGNGQSAREWSPSPKAIHFLKTLLIRNPEKRPDAADALRHPWLKPARNYFASSTASRQLTIESVFFSEDQSTDDEATSEGVRFKSSDMIIKEPNGELRGDLRHINANQSYVNTLALKANQQMTHTRPPVFTVQANSGEFR